MLNGTFGQNVASSRANATQCACACGPRSGIRLIERWLENAGRTLVLGRLSHRWPPAARPTRKAGARRVALVQVPPEAGFLVVMLGTSGQSRATDRAWFDDIQLIKIED